jgi:prolyl-tRNA editing enzyme YbaK/EbsC (Cys-tRNA(Pro) deacylase)
MQGHELWLEQCRLLDYRPEPRRYEAGTRTSEDAAKQLGCNVAHIAKSIVFEGQGGAVVVIASGANRVDRKKKLKSLLGYKPGMSDAAYIEANTGYLPGGVPPFGHVRPCTVLMDEDLFQYQLVWGAAGSADTVFPITPQELQFLSGAEVGNLKQEVNA